MPTIEEHICLMPTGCHAVIIALNCKGKTLVRGGPLLESVSEKWPGANLPATAAVSVFQGLFRLVNNWHKELGNVNLAVESVLKNAVHAATMNECMSA
jgi:hypothetical protein